MYRQGVSELSGNPYNLHNYPIGRFDDQSDRDTFMNSQRIEQMQVREAWLRQ